MKKILFVCHGNICRSPMAEYIFLQLAQEAGRGAAFAAASAATSTEELGNPVYASARRVLAARGIDCTGKRARQMTRCDYAAYDLLIGMDRNNVRNMLRITGGDPDGKVRLLLDYAGGGEVADPWYTGDFAAAERDIERGCTRSADAGMTSFGAGDRPFLHAILIGATRLQSDLSDTIKPIAFSTSSTELSTVFHVFV